MRHVIGKPVEPHAAAAVVSNRTNSVSSSSTTIIHANLPVSSTTARRNSAPDGPEEALYPTGCTVWCADGI